MYRCDYGKLQLSFNEFHELVNEDLPQYGEYCLLELKDGRHTAGSWNPNNDSGAAVSGQFIRGTADSVSAEEVSKWHSLERYDLSDCLKEEDINYINIGPEKEGAYSVQFDGFKSLNDGDFPVSEQYCLLILMNGGMAAGRWDELEAGKEGQFIYAPALASYDMDEVWAWTPLSPDSIFELEEEREQEKKREEELNRNPSVDNDLFKYGTDIDAYYQ